jgi:hypothetical protein
VGYDKPLMIFHMARLARGDAAFVESLRGLYRAGLGRRVGAEEVLRTLTPPDEDWFATWWQRTGAPRLALECCEVSEKQGAFRITGTLRQVQGGPPFPLRVPVQVLVGGEEFARETVVTMDDVTASVDIALPDRPLVLQVDSAFDVMRIPDAKELPPALGELLDAEDAVAVLAPDLPDGLRTAYRAIAGRVGARIVGGPEVGEARAVWVFGKNAPQASESRDALAQRITQGDSRVVVTRVAEDRIRAVVEAASPAAATALAGKLPHYGKYGLLGFSGDRGRNVFKGEIAASQSPMRVVFAKAWEGRVVPLAPRPALTR